MKKHSYIITGIVILISFGLVCATIIFLDARNYQGYVEDNTEGMISLTSKNVSNAIDLSMNKPFYAAKAMANNTFLQTWLKNEKQESIDNIVNYLNNYIYQDKFDTAFLVSEETHNYYFQDGLNKTISSNNEHDIWYYNFLEKDTDFDIQLDTDEINNEDVTLFINYRVKDSDGKILGVTGVGVKLDHFYENIELYQKQYDLDVYLINEDETKNSYGGDTSLFISLEQLKNKLGEDNIKIPKSNEPTTSWYYDNNKQYCMTSFYQDTLHWDIIVIKKTDTVMEVFLNRLMGDAGIFGIFYIFGGFLIVIGIISYERKIIHKENIDELTGLINVKMFSNKIKGYHKLSNKKICSIFMVDIDDFKKINDTKGHMFGNDILSAIGESFEKYFGDNGIVARWGGDEFIGVVELTPQQTKEVFESMIESLKVIGSDIGYVFTISVGIVLMNDEDIADNIKSADKALYDAKNQGKNQIVIK